MINSIKRNIRNADALTIPVGITYKGEKEFSTTFGGFMTILMVLSFGVFAFELVLSNVLNPQFRDSTYWNFNEAIDVPPFQMNFA